MADPALSPDEAQALAAQAVDPAAPEQPSASDETGASAAGSTERSAVDGSAPGEATGSSLPPPVPGEVRRYDLSSQERLVRGRMPTLELILERFARDFRTSLFNFMRRPCTVSVGAVQVQKYNALLRSFTDAALYNMVHVRPLRGMGLVVCDAPLLFCVIDSLFGGSGGRPAQLGGREFSATERRINQRLVDVFRTDYARAWSSIYPIELEYARCEADPQFATVARPAESMVSTCLTVDFGEGCQGNLHICIPYSTFEPIRDVLYAAPPGGDTGSNDSPWLTLLKQQIQAAQVEMVAELAHGQATVGELMALKPGDFIELDRAPTLVAKVAGVPIVACDYGTLGRHYGLRVREFLTPSADAAALSAASAASRPGS